ncbi:signal peptide peptidase-domain-containing protein [Gilbertella persicaria]|uniref:signal peptide peptidase-domain-containing protein n=1 Tax=Gilbertella persicaria TaxID=101096 RepID=UPI00221EF9EA|nr:signal peptide peptidase-domain-containing protein [Gilbertella persicaria]KAI8090993.1 signal peptide peptidase-domain-containing protein [Gilbertella persicaria]
MSTESLLHLTEDRTSLHIASIGLLSLAIIPIVVGSFSSLLTLTQPKTRSRTRYPRRAKSTRHRREYIQYASDDEVHDVFEQHHDQHSNANVLTIKSTFLLPLASSSVAYMISSLIHTVDPHYVNQLVTLVACLLSCTALSKTTMTVAEQYLPHHRFFYRAYHLTITNQDNQKLCHFNVTLIHLGIFMVSALLAVTFAWTHHWVIGNLFAMSLSIKAIRSFTLDSFSTGFFLLTGMLAYDLFWVFGTDAMLEISKALKDTPISVVWPKTVHPQLLSKLIKKDHFFSMFGIAEIIVPGIFIAYCLRFDRYNAYKKNILDFPKPYFLSALAAYALGAGSSIYTVHFTKQPEQSAFVFVVPALILSTILTAMYRRELNVITDCSAIFKTWEQEVNALRRSSFAEDAYGAVTDAVEGTRKAVEPYVEETRKTLEPYVGDAMENTYQLVDDTRKAVEPYVDEAVKGTKKAIHSVATAVQEQTVVDENTEESDERANRRPRRQRRPTYKSVSPRATRRRSTSKRTKRNSTVANHTADAASVDHV